MISARLLELIQKPDTLEENDLSLIRKEMGKFPYAQHLHALNLLGTHRFDKENYPEVLSTAAAFTTDKKILYNLINPPVKESESETLEAAGISAVQTREPKEDQTASRDGVSKNRLLFEGESLEDGSLGREVIDYQATEESGSLVLTKVAAPDVLPAAPEKEASTSFKSSEQSPPQAMDEPSEAALQEQVQQHAADLSFARVEEFLPEIQITSSQTFTTAPQTNSRPNRHELEMKALVAKVERELLEKKKREKENSNLQSLAQDKEEVSATTEYMTIEPFMPLDVAPPSLPERVAEEKPEEKAPEAAPRHDWKPLSVELLPLDGAGALSASPAPTNINALSEAQNAARENTGALKGHEPLNKPDQQPAENPKDSSTEEPSSSNVVDFIATWQNWLKIERPVQTEREGESEAEATEEPLTEKTTVIDRFIETQPKISKLKDDREYVVREKEGDISHLMTETLAGLYIEQRLYNRAIQAFEILMKKKPDLKDKYREKIKEIKLLRNPNR